MPTVARVRFFERGSGRLWLGAPSRGDALSTNAKKALEGLRAQLDAFVLAVRDVVELAHSPGAFWSEALGLARRAFRG